MFSIKNFYYNIKYIFCDPWVTGKDIRFYNDEIRPIDQIINNKISTTSRIKRDTNKINMNITGRRLTIGNRETLLNIAVISLLSLSTNIIFMFNILPLYPFKYIILAIDTIIFSIVDPKLKIAKKGDRAPSTCDIDKVYILTCSQLSLVSTMLATGFLMSKTEYTIMVNSIFFVVLLLSLFALSVAVNNKTDILHNIATSICGSSQKKDT